jgi:predicted outer membrane repeat protein
MISPRNTFKLLLIAILIMCSNISFANNLPIAGFGKALSFNGTDEYASIVRPIKDNFTIEFWLKTSQISPTGTHWWAGKGIIDAKTADNADNFGISLLNNKLAFGIGNPDTTILSTSSINNGKWHHIAVTRKKTNGKIQIYINGILETTDTASTNSLTSATYIYFGLIQNSSHFFNGQLDEIRMWDIVRTSTEIQDNMTVISGLSSIKSWNFENGLTDAVFNNIDETNLVDSILGENSFTTNDSSSITKQLYAYDFENDSLIFNIIDNPNQGSINITGNQFTYTPVKNGNYSFTYKANDGNGDSNIATVNIFVVSVDNNSDINDGNYGNRQTTLREAINIANSGDTITFASNMNGQTITLNDELIIDKDLTIDAQNLIIKLSGNDTNRIFKVNNATKLTLKNLTIMNGYASSSGGAIYVSGTVNIFNTTFKNNNSNTYGGAISIKKILLIENSTFYSNSSINGGAIKINTTGIATINNSTFSHNSGTNGADINNKGVLNLTNSILANSSNGSDPNCTSGGNMNTNLNNLIEDGTCNPAISVDPKLGNLKNNSGNIIQTDTIALLANSPAIDTGSPTN